MLWKHARLRIDSIGFPTLDVPTCFTRFGAIPGYSLTHWIALIELFYCVYGIFGCSVEETSPSTAEHFDNNPRSFFLFCMPSW